MGEPLVLKGTFGGPMGDMWGLTGDLWGSMGTHGEPGGARVTRRGFKGDPWGSKGESLEAHRVPRGPMGDPKGIHRIHGNFFFWVKSFQKLRVVFQFSGVQTLRINTPEQDICFAVLNV